MKQCSKCYTEKKLEQFNKDCNSKDGHGRWCRKCMSLYKHINKHKRKKYDANYYKTNKYKKKSSQRQKDRRASGCIKEKARQLLQRAVASGKIFKPTICSDCEKTFPVEKIQGHHIDYSKPYFVQWICRKCHDKLEPPKPAYFRE